MIRFYMAYRVFDPGIVSIGYAGIPLSLNTFFSGRSRPDEAELLYAKFDKRISWMPSWWCTDCQGRNLTIDLGDPYFSAVKKCWLEEGSSASMG